MHMESVDIIPNRTTCNMLLAVYCRGGFHNSALRVLKHLFQPLQLGEGEEVPSFLVKGQAGQGRKAPTLNPLEALIQGSQEGGAARPLVGGEGSDGSIEGDGSSAVVTVADDEEQAEFTSSGAQLHSWTPKTFTLLASLAIRRGHYEDCALPLLQAMQCKLETGGFSRQDEEGAAGYSIDHPTAWQLAQDHHVFKEVLEELELKPLQPEQAAELHDMMASLGFSADKQIKQAGVQGSVGAKRIAKFSRTGNVNRDKVKQWEVLEEGARLVNGDLLPRRPRHRQLDIRDQEGKDERRSGFADANAVAQA
jgi:pentatricopeptide repeat protein